MPKWYVVYYDNGVETERTECANRTEAENKRVLARWIFSPQIRDGSLRIVIAHAKGEA